MVTVFASVAIRLIFSLLPCFEIDVMLQVTSVVRICGWGRQLGLILMVSNGEIIAIQHLVIMLKLGEYDVAVDGMTNDPLITNRQQLVNPIIQAIGDESIDVVMI